MQAYFSPAAFEDVKPALQALSEWPLAILSNGTPEMLESAVRHNGLESYFSAIISVDTVKTYKPSPRAYALGPRILNLPSEEILFVSSNLWDAAGAKAFGYQHRSVVDRDARDRLTAPNNERLRRAYLASLPVLERQFTRRATMRASVARTAAARGLIASGVESAAEILGRIRNCHGMPS